MLAVDYQLGSGLRPFWFHVFIFALFVALALLLAFVIYRLLDRAANHPGNRWIAFAAAAWYGLHPANADSVNYIIGSSEVISTLAVVASLAVYLGLPHVRRYYVYAQCRN